MRIKGTKAPETRRIQNYPPIGNQLDAIYKGFQALRQQGFQLPEETIAWLDRVAVVKDQNPVGQRPMQERFK